MLTKVDYRIIANVNNLGIVDFDFLFTLLHGNNVNSKYELRYKLKKRISKLKELMLIDELKSTIGICYFKLRDEAKVVLSKLGTRYNANILNYNSTLFVHHSNLMRVIAPIVHHYNCYYRTEYILKDFIRSSTVPDFIAIINKKKIIFEIERSQKADELIRGKLSAYSIEYREGYVFYITETQALADKINSLKKTLTNSNSIFAYEVNDFINNFKDLFGNTIFNTENQEAFNVH